MMDSKETHKRAKHVADWYTRDELVQELEGRGFAVHDHESKQALAVAVVLDRESQKGEQ